MGSQTFSTLFELLIISVLLGIPATYILHCLLLEEKDSHEGPFPSTSRFVVFPTKHAQQVAMFDWIRRFFGAYRIIKGDVEAWNVKVSALGEVWTCPFCLSFWSSLVFSIPLGIVIQQVYPSMLLVIIPLHFAIAVTSQILHKVIFD